VKVQWPNDREILSIPRAAKKTYLPTKVERVEVVLAALAAGMPRVNTQNLGASITAEGVIVGVYLLLLFFVTISTRLVQFITAGIEITRASESFKTLYLAA
jgi:hypothetical protein